MITYGAASSQPDEPVPACDPELARTTAELARVALLALLVALSVGGITQVAVADHWHTVNNRAHGLEHGVTTGGGGCTHEWWIDRADSRATPATIPASKIQAGSGQRWSTNAPSPARSLAVTPLSDAVDALTSR
jgi:hypothetical protein